VQVAYIAVGNTLLNGAEVRIKAAVEADLQRNTCIFYRF
jgi:hypothetical protein